MARCHQCAAETQRRDDGTNQCPVCYQLIPDAAQYAADVLDPKVLDPGPAPDGLAAS
jgi:hypothetical protein